MITYRNIKGIDLTHEELDENFRTFDMDAVSAIAINTFCPIGDKYIFVTKYDTSKEYSILGSPISQTGIMTATPIVIPLNALVSGTPKTKYNANITPEPIENYSLADTKVVQIDGDGTYNVDFNLNVDLIEVESNISHIPSSGGSYGTYLNGHIVTTSTLTPTDIFTVDDETVITLGNELTIPASFVDNDPFGDASQVHYFKFEGNLIDENGNSNITGNASFGTEALYGTQALKLTNEEELQLALENSNFSLNGGWSLIVAGRRSEGSTLHNASGINSSEVRKMLGAVSNDYVDNIVSQTGSHLWAYLPPTEFESWFNTADIQITKKTSNDVFISSGKIVEVRINGKVSTTDDPYVYFTGCYQTIIRDGGLITYGTGWTTPSGDAPVWQVEGEEGILSSTLTTMPHTIKFNHEGSTGGGEMFMDGLRVFNRPITGLEMATVTKHPTGNAVKVYDTNTTKKGHSTDVSLINDLADIQDIALEVDGTQATLGTPTKIVGDYSDQSIFKITYQYRVGVTTDKVALVMSNISSSTFYGDTITVKGYKKI